MRDRNVVYRVYYRDKVDGSTSYIDSQPEEIQRILDYLGETGKDFMYASNVEIEDISQQKITEAKLYN